MPDKKRRRWPWFLLGGLAILLLLAAIVLPSLLDVENYRGRIEQALEQATGWEAELGSMDFSVLRGLVLQVSPARLAAAGEGSYVEIESIEVRAALLPLLRGQLNVRSVGLIRPEIVLVRADEKRGWILPETPAESERPAAPSEPTARAEPAPPEEEKTGFEVSVDRIRVKDGRLGIEDRAGDPPLSLALEGLDLSVSPTTGEISGRGELSDNGGRIRWQGDLGESLVVKLEALRTELIHPWVGADLVHGGGSLSGEIEVGFPLAIDARLSADNLTLLSGERPFDKATLGLRVAGKGGAWSLENLEFDGDGARVVGGGSLLPALALKLELPETALDAALHASESVLPLPLDVTPPGAVQATLWVDRPEGGELTYAAEGTLSAAAFRAAEMLPPARDVRAEFELDRAGALSIRVLEGNVGGGPLRGTARIDSIDPPGRLSFDGGIQQAVLGQLLGGMVGDSAERIGGATGIGADVGIDLSRPEIDARALSGRLDLDSRQVSLPGWDLEGAVRRGIENKLGKLADVAALLDDDLARKLGPGDAEKAGEVVEELLESMEARIDFDSWPWKIEKLALGARDLEATGTGTFDPIEGVVDFALTSRLDKNKTARLVEKNRELRVLVGRDGRLTVPLEIEGPLLSPSISVDLSQVGRRQKEELVEGLIKNLLKKKD